MAVSGLFKAGSGLVKKSLAYQAADSVQSKAEEGLKDSTGIEVNKNVSSFINGSVPTYLLEAAEGVSKFSRLRSALLWGGLSLLYDKMMGDSEDAAEQARQNTDQPLMPKTQKVVDAHQQFATIMQHAEDERAMAASTHPTIDMNGHYNLTEHGQRIINLLNKSAAARQAGQDQRMLELAGQIENPTRTLTPSEQRMAKMAYDKLARKANAAQRATAEAAEHTARIARIKDLLNASGPNARMATVRAGYKASAAANKLKKKKQAKGSNRMHAAALKPQSKGKAAAANARTTGFAGMPNQNERKQIWTDKNGKVYHRQVTLPDLSSRESGSLAKYRK